MAALALTGGTDGMAPGGSERRAQLGRNMEKPLDSSGFFALGRPIRRTGKTLSALLDIGGTLC
jgi:hypothetical protein